MVSQHLVNWIQLVGLLMGLFGFFFLSTEVFGDESAPWFRALLPATGMGLGALVVATSGLTFLAKYLSHGPALPSWPVWAALAVIIVVGYLGGVQFRVSPIGPRLRTHIRRQLIFIGAAAAVCLVVALVTGGAYFSGYQGYPIQYVSGGKETLFVLFCYALGALIYSAGLALLFAGSILLDKDRLKALGFGLSLIAILTQFVQPVLDIVFKVTVK